MEEERLYDVYALDEDIKDLEKYIAFSKKNYNFSHDTDWKWHEELSEKIQHLIEAYKDVKREAEDQKDKNFGYTVKIALLEKDKIELQNYMKKYLIPKSTIDLIYIPKSKIKEKIEELEKEKNTVIEEINFKAFYRITDLKNVEISVLQELLEEE